MTDFTWYHHWMRRRAAVGDPRGNRHTQNCPVCRQAQMSDEMLGAKLRSNPNLLPVSDPPADLWDRVSAGIDSRQASLNRSKPLFVWRPRLAVGVAVVSLALGYLAVDDWNENSTGEVETTKMAQAPDPESDQTRESAYFQQEKPGRIPNPSGERATEEIVPPRSNGSPPAMLPPTASGDQFGSSTDKPGLSIDGNLTRHRQPDSTSIVRKEQQISETEASSGAEVTSAILPPALQGFPEPKEPDTSRMTPETLRQTIEQDETTRSNQARNISLLPGVSLQAPSSYQEEHRTTTESDSSRQREGIHTFGLSSANGQSRKNQEMIAPLINQPLSTDIALTLRSKSEPFAESSNPGLPYASEPAPSGLSGDHLTGNRTIKQPDSLYLRKWGPAPMIVDQLVESNLGAFRAEPQPPASTIGEKIKRPLPKLTPTRQLATIYYRQGMDLLKQEKIKEALLAFQKALKTDPNHKGARRAIIELEKRKKSSPTPSQKKPE